MRRRPSRRVYSVPMRYLMLFVAMLAVGVAVPAHANREAAADIQPRVDHHIREAGVLVQHFETFVTGACRLFATADEWNTYAESEIDRMLLMVAHVQQAWVEAKRTGDDDVRRRAAKRPRRRMDDAPQILTKLAAWPRTTARRSRRSRWYRRIERDLPRRQSEIASLADSVTRRAGALSPAGVPVVCSPAWQIHRSPSRKPRSSPAAAPASASPSRSRFAKAGADVALCSRQLEHLEPCPIHSRSRPQIVLGAVDVRQEDQVKAMVERAVSDVRSARHHGQQRRRVVPLQARGHLGERWNAVIQINLNGVFLGCKWAGKHMLDRGQGTIINIASVAASTAPR